MFSTLHAHSRTDTNKHSEVKEHRRGENALISAPQSGFTEEEPEQGDRTEPTAAGGASSVGRNRVFTPRGKRGAAAQRRKQQTQTVRQTDRERADRQTDRQTPSRQTDVQEASDLHIETGSQHSGGILVLF